jgi:hypothetical protein
MRHSGGAQKPVRVRVENRSGHENAPPGGAKRGVSTGRDTCGIGRDRADSTPMSVWRSQTKAQACATMPVAYEECPSTPAEGTFSPGLE